MLSDGEAGNRRVHVCVCVRVWQGVDESGLELRDS